LQQGSGVILLTPHIGAFEVGVRAAARSVPVTVLYKPPRIAALRELVEAGRVTPGIVPVPGTAAGVRSMLRALRRGEAVGVLPDQVPTEGDGVWSPFFGRPAYTMTLPTRLAELTGAQVIVGWAQRLPRARGWVAHFEPLAGAPSPDAINQAMESVIRRLPEQYFWGYNRYKTPHGRAVTDGARSGGGS
jgi:KDO2-lipid IV(A) lauroyltransferase